MPERLRELTGAEAEWWVDGIRFAKHVLRFEIELQPFGLL